MPRTRVHITLQLRDGGETHGHIMNSKGSVGKRIFDPFEWTSGWTSVCAFSKATQPFLFFLNSTTGDAAIYNVLRHDKHGKPNGRLGAELITYNWKSGWTTATFYTTLDGTYLFLLKSSDGIVHVHEMNLDGTIGRRTATRNWSSGWTTAVPFSVGGSHFLFLLKKSNGIVHIQRLHNDGTIGGRVYAANWSSGWTSACFYTISNVTYLFLLKESDGTVHIHKMKSDGTVGLRVATRNWSSGWTTVVPFSMGSSHFLFLLKESDGTLHIQRLKDDGTIGARVEEQNWSSGWSDAVFYTIDTTTFLLLNKRSALRPLRRTFVEHLSVLGNPIGLYITDDQGKLMDNNRDFGLTSLTDSADIRVLCHNSVVRAPNGPIDHWIDLKGVKTGSTVEVLNDNTDDHDRFRILNRALEAYDRIFRSFEPFKTRGDFPLGKPASLSKGRTRPARIEIDYPDLGLQPLAYNWPSQIGTGFPIIHIKRKDYDPPDDGKQVYPIDRRLFGGDGIRPILIPGELAHGLHFSLLSQAQRDDLTSQYGQFLAFDKLTGGDATHRIDKETDPTVAFIESLDLFATRLMTFLLQNPGRVFGAQLLRDFIQHEFDENIVGTLDGTLERGVVKPGAALSGSSVEGAVYGAIFLDLARRRGVGLDAAVRAFFDSKQLTFGQFRTWVDDHRPELSAPLTEVAKTWGMSS